MQGQEEICAEIAKIVRDRSETRRLTQSDEILTELKERGLLKSPDLDDAADFDGVVGQVVRDNRDITEIRDRNGISFYYSDRSLSETYAGILLWKSDDPLWLMAQVVRDNSRRYPRPVPVASFQEPPFGLTGEEIAECLRVMGNREEYQDVARTVTSVGTQFLYSTEHLDPDHAFMLAEWLDVGQVNSP